MRPRPTSRAGAVRTARLRVTGLGSGRALPGLPVAQKDDTNFLGNVRKLSGAFHSWVPPLKTKQMLWVH